MAFPKAVGYGNLPNGNFSPVIYSKQVQLAFRKASTVEDITNNDYFGEIANMGDSVKIIKEPEVSVQSYARGTQITAQDLNDEDFTLVVDQANYYAFKIDSLITNLIDERISIIDCIGIAEIVTFIYSNRFALIYKIRS